MSLEYLTTTNYQVLVKSSLHGKVEEYEIIKDKRDPFLYIDAYLLYQFYKKTCVATEGRKITILNITTQLIGLGNISGTIRKILYSI